jgi:hypothetical protein
MKSSQKVKDILIELAIEDKLPMDLTQLDASIFDKVFNEENVKQIVVDSVEIMNNEPDFLLHCYDGVAIGSNGKFRLHMAYPLLSELTNEQVNDAMEYRYGNKKSDWPSEVSVDDIMMRFGKVISSQSLNA